MRPSLLFWRRLCQGVIALGFVVVPLLNARQVTLISGNFLSLDFFGLNFMDPLAFLQTLAGGWPSGQAVTGAIMVLLFALLLGRVFCGWMCPYGLASELVFSLRGLGRTPEKEASAGVKAAGGNPFVFRGAATAVGLLAVLLFLPEPVLNQLSMPGWYTRVLQTVAFAGQLSGVALIFPALLLLEGITGKRFWCRYLCPQSVLLSLFAAVPRPGLRLRYIRRECSCAAKDRPCLRVCSLALNPRENSLSQRLNCNNCGDCVDACRSRGKALRLSLKG
ncbi:MAG: 4Fe-4S binding protein [Desulfovibrionaceae bacterium]|nr:4Fe-4S binding protein [Desulfovibrionaceae bacterium]